MFEYENQVLQNCVVDVKNAYQLSEEQFANIRRNGIGASDASVILKTNPWASLEELIEDKLANGVTSKNMEIAAKPNVRKGRDLEPIILQKAETQLQTAVEKPLDMYRFKDYPWLTVNYDGIAKLHNRFIPVEAKYVSPYGEKDWDWSKAWDGKNMPPQPTFNPTLSTKDRCEIAAKHYGIPSYYYCQLQQQMMGLDTIFGLMAALRDKDWTLRLFFVHRDPVVQQDIVTESLVFWNMIMVPRKGLPSYTKIVMQAGPKKLANEEEY